MHLRKVLIVRFSSIGDIVLTTPVIRCLKKQRKVEVHFLTKAIFAPLLENNPYIDRLILLDKKLSDLLPLLRGEKYDAIIDLHKNWRSMRIRWALGVRSFSFPKLNLLKWLFTNFKINLLPSTHVVDRYFHAVHTLGVKNDGYGLEYFLPTKVLASVCEKFPPHTYIAFSIGAAHNTKKLPKESILKICMTTPATLVLLGGPTERETGAYIAAIAGNRVKNCCGVCLHETAALIAGAKKVIAFDTGMMHIAAAFQKEIISIWGSTVPAFGMYPYFGKKGSGRNITFEVKGLPCRPCSKIGKKRCPKEHFRCMYEQNLEAIADELSR